MSVVLPVRDQARFLGEQIACLAAQDYAGDWELVLADNGSSDGSPDVALAAAGDLPAVRVVDASDRQGASHARNAGAAAARGDLLAFCDADNAARPGWLRGMARAAQLADVVAGRSLVNGINDPDRAAWSGRPTIHQPLVAMGYMPFASGGNCAYWSDAFRALGGFDEDLLAAEDIDLSWRAQLHGYRLEFAVEAQMDRRCPSRLQALLRQHWRWGRAAGELSRRYRAAGLEQGPRAEIQLLRALWQQRRSLWLRGDRGYLLAQFALTVGRVAELARVRGPGGESEPIQPASRPSFPN